MRRHLWGFALALCTGLAPMAQAQSADPDSGTPILVIDFERVFVETAYGQRIAADVEEARALVQAENDRLAQELLAEESALTEARTTMEPDAFREAAEAFNEKAQSVRASREAEQARLVNLRDSERARFVERIQPLIAEMMEERGAIVAMDRRSVIRAIGSANATADVITRINATLGDGTRDPGDRPTLRPDELNTSGDDTLILPDINGTSDDLSAPE